MEEMHCNQQNASWHDLIEEIFMVGDSRMLHEIKVYWSNLLRANPTTRHLLLLHDANNNRKKNGQAVMIKLMASCNFYN